MLLLAIQCLLGLIYANASEWLIHKYILHGLGKNKQSFWAYHWYEHHLTCYQHNMLDAGYQTINLMTWNTQSKELLVLIVIVLLHGPLFTEFPVFISTVYLSLMLYYYKHRRAHLDSSWAKQYLPWHYDHHIYNSNANWCVTWPWCDYLLGTRIKNIK
ncbi:MAG: sterol desaturase family protein [Methylococcaceae bacterium]